MRYPHFAHLSTASRCGAPDRNLLLFLIPVAVAVGVAGFGAVGIASAGPAAPSQVWQPVGPEGGEVGTLGALGGDEPRFFAVASELLWTSDRGEDWRVVKAQLGEAPPLDLSARSVAAASPDRLYVSRGLNVLHSADRGATWSAGPEVIGCLIPVLVEAAPSAPEVVVTSGGFFTAGCGIVNGCALFRSDDGGESFRCIRGELEEGRFPSQVDRLAFDPRDDRVMYADAGGRRLVRTLDGGETWEFVLRGEDPLRGVGEIQDVVVPPVAPDRVWLATEDGLWMSPDRGETWVRPEKGLPEDAAVSGLAPHPRRANTLYAAVPGHGIFVTDDGGGSWQPLTSAGLPVDDLVGSPLVDPEDPRRILVGTRDRGLWRLERQDVSPCVPGSTVLCLQGGRFEVTASWEDFQGGRGLGQARPETGDSGWFWFFDDANIELLVKVLDGRVINQHFWVFYGSLSNVAYRLRVRDAATGQVLEFDNPAGRFASVGETAAFPRPPVPEPKAGAGVPDERVPVAPGAGRGRMEVVELAAVEPLPARTASSTGSTTTAAPAPCEPGPETLCLQDGRFQVTVAWRDFQGGTGPGRAVPETDDSGFFWFFEEDNLELVVKVLDARPLEPRFWFFYGALSNVAYEIRVLDRASGREKVYRNPEGRFGSVGDTGTFPAVDFCGGIAGFPCLEGQVCDPDPGSCQVSDVGGTCRLLPEACVEIFEPVCGCDGRTYVNDCERLQARVAKDHDGACDGGA